MAMLGINRLSLNPLWVSFNTLNQQRLMSNNSLAEDLIDCVCLPHLIPDNEVADEILQKTPEPEFVRNVKSNPFAYKNTNAPYLNQNSTATHINNVTKDSMLDPFAFLQNPTKVLPFSIEQKSSYEDSSLTPIKDKNPRQIGQDKPTGTTYMNPTPPNSMFQAASVQRQKQERPLTYSNTRESHAVFNSDALRIPVRRLTHAQMQDYQHRLSQTNSRVAKIGRINQQLETEIQESEQRIEGKMDENRRLHKKISDLNERIKEEQKGTGQFQERTDAEKYELQANLTELKRRCGDNICQINNQLVQQRFRAKELEQRFNQLVCSLEAKGRELARVKEFSQQIQRGILQMRFPQF